MLKIRTEQMAAFAEPVAESFECRVYTHLTRVLPEACDRLGEPAVREWIGKGMREAQRYGITGDYDVMRFIDLMFILGPDFDRDSGLPWAAQTLNDAALAGPAKMDALYRRVKASPLADR